MSFPASSAPAVALIGHRRRRRRLGRSLDANPDRWIVPLAVLLGVSVIAHGFGAEGADWSAGSLVHNAGHWVVMAVAMMLPTVRPAARLAALGTLFSRRRATVAWYVAGFAAVWAGFGLVAAGAGAALPLRSGPAGLWLPAAALVAMAWQGSAFRRRAMSRCSPTPTLPLRGWTANWRTITSGAGHGRRCLFTCWASMLVMVASPHPLLMGALLGIHAYERRSGPDPFAEQRWRAPAAAYGAIAGAGAVIFVLRVL